MVVATDNLPRYAEFFAGGGMVRAALKDHWQCVMANDIDAMKCAVYARNWGDEALLHMDVRDLPSEPLLQAIDLYWASSPCQDFSLAGKGLGLKGQRSGVFHDWIAAIEPAIESGFAPRLIAFENVVGLLTRNAGRDFAHVCKTLMRMGYNVGAMEIDTRHFLPQSRPRLFVVAARNDLDISGLAMEGPGVVFHTRKLTQFVSSAPRDIRNGWIWWSHGVPADGGGALQDLVDGDPDTRWLGDAQVDALLSMMDPVNLEKVRAARGVNALRVGTLYKRGRPDAKGVVRQRAEVRFDGIAGCLRTPAGGSSRQTLFLVNGNETRARLLSSRETARLMGLPDSYVLPSRYTDAYRVTGDGVAVPIVAYLHETIFKKVLALKQKKNAA
ncbi:DNA cytosine methyltransferase [Aestuariivita sp.]|uniref:DNA cytosine methyltransferase n=1 Tax=Aestuariivita sp. TaxID=1872407 RepID=UPI003BAF5966